MQGGRGRGDPFFGMGGDPFAGFGGMPSLFGGRDPFDDPFFTNPMAGMLQPNPFGHMGSSLLGGSPFGGSFMGGGPFGHARSPFMGGSPFGSSLLGPSGSPFMDAHEPRGYEHRQSMPNTSRGPVIEELNSDDENDEQQAGHSMDYQHMHGRSTRQPYVEQPYDGSGGRELMQPQYGNQFNVMHDTHSRPQTQSFTFQSSTVTYGGSNGAYYSASTTRRAGSDGLKFEEHKEADSVTGRLLIGSPGESMIRATLFQGISNQMVKWIQCKRCTTSTKMSLLVLKRLGKEKLASFSLAGLVETVLIMVVLKDLASQAGVVD